MRKRVLEKKLKQKIAKSLILKEFMNLYPEPLATPTPSAPRPENVHADRLKRAASLVTARDLTSVYDIEDEFGKKLEISLQHAIGRLAKTCDMSRRRADEQFLLDQCISQLQASLRGCDVYFGLLKPGGNVMRYSEFCSQVSLVNKPTSSCHAGPFVFLTQTRSSPHFTSFTGYNNRGANNSPF